MTMTNGDRIETSVFEPEMCSSKGESARVSISLMSSSELLRFGMRAKLRCSEGADSNGPGLAQLAAQLNEARSEWNRRHPDLPLRDSF